MRLLGSLLLLHCLACTSNGEVWTPATYPNPSTPSGAALCGRTVQRSAVCDPDGIISTYSANVVEGTIKEIENAVAPYQSDKCTEHSTDLPGFQVAVALMEKMQLSGSSPQAAAQAFAAELFDAWGVGDAKCGNGVLLLLSKGDKQVYIRGGIQTMKVAPEARLKTVVDGMVGPLREGNFDRAVEQAVVDLGLVLAGAHLPPQDDNDDGQPWVLYLVLTLLVPLVGFLFCLSRRQEEGRARCRNLLDKLRAEQVYAQTYKRYPAKSCPICFEDFAVMAPRPSAPPLSLKGEDAGGPHKGDVTAPLLEKRHHRESLPHAGAASSSKTGQPVKAGQPLNLPCGHAFCDPCISQWLGQNTSCPICRKQVEVPGGSAPVRRERDESYDADMYAMEVRYRMGNLHRSYPYWVTWSMVTDSEEACRRGDAVDWNAVRESQLATERAHHASYGETGSSHDFGGGSSHGGGGVGGTW